MPAPSCRLFVILAREAPRAVIFRRGPTRQAQQILWHTDTDRFEPGQWLKGRLYERRCDLSPDGTLLIYFAAKHTGPKYSWTAISKPPYFTALALWKKGDSWDGGGLFTKSDSIWLNHPEAQCRQIEGRLPTRFKLHNNGERTLGEDGPVYFTRLERDGWVTIDTGEFQPPRKVGVGYTTIRPEILIKSHDKAISLECKSHMAGFKRVEHFSAILPGAGPVALNANWADFDQSGRLVFARNGRLFALSRQESKTREVQLADFASFAFKEVLAPDWASSW